MPRDYQVTHSLFTSAFPVKRVAGEADLEVSKYRTIFHQFLTVLLDLHSTFTKMGPSQGGDTQSHHPGLGRPLGCLPWCSQQCSDSRHWLETASEIPDRTPIPYWLTKPQRSKGSVYGQILNRSWEILPVERKLKDSFGPHNCCLAQLVCYRNYNGVFERQKHTSVTSYDHNSSHGRSPSFATQQRQSAVHQVKARGLSPTNAVSNQRSNIRSFSGPSLPANAKTQPNHAVQKTSDVAIGIFAGRLGCQHSSPHGKTRFSASEANDRLATNHVASALNYNRMWIWQTIFASPIFHGAFWSRGRTLQLGFVCSADVDRLSLN